MAKINATNVRKGNVFEIDGKLYVVTDFQHTTPGKGHGFVQVKMKALADGVSLQKRLRSDETLETAFLETREMEYLYRDTAGFVFMDTTSYEQLTISEDVMVDCEKFLPHNATIKIVFHEGTPVSVDLPAAVVLEVTEAEPGAKGDTVSNVQKPATCETGLQLKVPIYVEQGTKIKVDTRTGEFLERA